MSALELVHAGPEWGPAIRRLLASVFPDNPKTDERIMQWQYWDNPYGPADSFLWTDDGEVVSHYANVPVPLRTKRRRLGVLAVDAATAPGYRDRGLYQKLLEESVRIGRERDLGLSLYFETRSGPSKRWDVAKVRLEPFVLPLDAEWLAQRLHVPRLLAASALHTFLRPPPPTDACESTEVPQGIGDLWEAMHSGGEWGIVKDDIWWRWRFAGHPDGAYRFFEIRDGNVLRGAAAIRSGRRPGDRVVYLLEVLARDESAARALIGSIARSEPDAVAIVARATRTSPFVRFARAAGLRRIPDRFETEHPWVTWWPALVDFEAAGTIPWSITYGDTDTI